MEKEKVKQAIDILNEPDTGVDCWLVIEKESEVLSDPVMDFIVGSGATWLSFFLFFKTGERYAIVGNLDVEKFKRLELFDEIFPYKGSPRDDLLKLLGKHDPQTIALNYSVDSPTADGLTYGKYLKLLELLAGTDYKDRFISAEGIIAKLRGRKSPEEVRRIKRAIEITLDIYEQVTTHVKAGMTESEVARFITGERQKTGFAAAWEEDHCPSVFAGPQETGAHSGPTDKVLERGQVFITIVQSIQLAFEALRPGVNGFDIDKIARDYIVSQGYKEYPHALGHQVGRSTHDGSALLAPDWERYGKLPFLPLEEGQVFTIEPRLYIAQGVVTVEEMVLITKAGAEWLSEPQRKLYLIK
jgi:Xaa-Pro aminopeptidase